MQLLSSRPFYGRQADISWLRLSRKQDRHRRGRSITDAFRHFETLNQRNPMKPVLRYQSQLLIRRSYKPCRGLRIRPAKLNFSFRPVRFGVKPQINTVL